MLNMGAHPLGWSAEFPCTRVAAFVALRSVKAQLAGAPVDDGDLHRQAHVKDGRLVLDALPGLRAHR